MFIAERQGFEPWEQLPVHRISSAARSTTPASLQNFVSPTINTWLAERQGYEPALLYPMP